MVYLCKWSLLTIYISNMSLVTPCDINITYLCVHWHDVVTHLKNIAYKTILTQRKIYPIESFADKAK
jgi:hypothetical protein